MDIKLEKSLRNEIRYILKEEYTTEANFLKRGVSKLTTALSMNNNLLNTSTGNYKAEKLKSGILGHMLKQLQKPVNLRNWVSTVKEVYGVLESILKEFSPKSHWKDIQKKYDSLQQIYNNLLRLAQRMSQSSDPNEDLQKELVGELKQLYDISYNEGY